MNQALGFLNNDYVTVALALFLGLYGVALSRVELPDFVRNLFNNAIFRVVFLALLLVFRFDKQPSVALTVAIVFVLTLQYLHAQEVRENFAYLESFRQLRH